MKKIYGGKIIRLYLTKRRLPNGYLAKLEVIKHPGAVLTVPFLTKEKIVLIRQYRPVINSYIWELPAGVLKKGEDPLKCAKRETVEEIGYGYGRWKRLGFIHTAPGYTNEKIIIYEAKGLEKVGAKKEADEVITPRILSRKKIGRLFRSGKIMDAKTICALKLSNII